ncbi:MAG: hypothetical protein AABN34_15830 [Acidobacteriota bacterium]
MSHSLSWDSDAVNAMNDFLICRYSLEGSTAREVYVEFGGGRIDFINKDGSGRGDALALAVYEGAAPATLFRGKAIDFGKSLIVRKSWAKQEKLSSLTLDPETFRIAVRPGVKVLSVVLAGVDGWIDTRVAVQINGLKMLSKPQRR